MSSLKGKTAPALSIADAAELIRAAAGRCPGLHLERVAEVGGRYSALFEVQPNATYSKWVATPSHAELNDLLSSVLDTLEHVNGENLVNVFASQMFEYLCAEMLPSDGRPVALTIAGVKEEAITGPRGESVKMIVSFKERPKKLILNKTNARALARALGPETDAWPGASVTLGVESIKVGRETVPSIRVRSATAAQRQGQGRGRATRPAAPAFSDAGTLPPNGQAAAANGPESAGDADGRAVGTSGNGDDGGELRP
jgi:hypothetical protein